MQLKVDIMHASPHTMPQHMQSSLTSLVSGGGCGTVLPLVNGVQACECIDVFTCYDIITYTYTYHTRTHMYHTHTHTTHTSTHTHTNSNTDNRTNQCCTHCVIVRFWCYTLTVRFQTNSQAIILLDDWEITKVTYNAGNNGAMVVQLAMVS